MGHADRSATVMLQADRYLAEYVSVWHHIKGQLVHSASKRLLLALFSESPYERS